MTLSTCRGTVGVLVAVLLAACSNHSGFVPTQSNPIAPDVLSSLPMQRGEPDVKPIPSCKGQTTTKQYASVGAKTLSTKGGTLCVPRFKGWGGSISYPGPTVPGITMSLISSTTAYSGPLWPPNPPGPPIFYIQFTVSSSSVDFGSKVPKGGELASKQLKVNKPYTVVAALTAFGSLWENLGECYTKASAGTYGPSLTGIGRVLAGHGFAGAGTRGVVQIVPGKFVSNRC
jgi:hypothetical protein